MSQQVLLIEDSADIRLMVESALMSSGVRIASAGTGAEAIELAKSKAFDLILLDIGLPDRDGFELFIELQKILWKKDAPVIFLTGKAEVSDKVAAFALGAEDYVVKPFNLMELRARVEAKLRRAQSRSASPDQLEVGPFSFDMPAQRVYHAEGKTTPRELGLTPIEFKIFLTLARRPDRIYSREELLRTVWGANVHVYDRTVDSHICTLRRKLGPAAWYIGSVQGEGYRFVLRRPESRLVDGRGAIKNL